MSRTKMDYPTSLDEIDQWLFDSFGILPGCCASQESVRYTVARMVAEALWPKKEEEKVISESRGIIEGFDIVNGSLTLSLRTSVMSYESGSIEDAVIRLPYTGRIDDAKDIFFHGPGLVRIIVEAEY